MIILRHVQRDGLLSFLGRSSIHVLQRAFEQQARQAPAAPPVLDHDGVHVPLQNVVVDRRDHVAARRTFPTIEQA